MSGAYGRQMAATGEERSTPAKSASGSCAIWMADEVVLLHDSDFYSSAGSWTNTLRALPSLFRVIEAKGLSAVSLRGCRSLDRVFFHMTRSTVPQIYPGLVRGVLIYIRLNDRTRPTLALEAAGARRWPLWLGRLGLLATFVAMSFLLCDKPSTTPRAANSS